MSAGMALGSVVSLRERVNRVERSIDSIGGRVGMLERQSDVTASRVDDELSRPYRIKPP